MRMPAGTFEAGSTPEVDAHQLEPADLPVAGCGEERPDRGLVGESASVDHDTRANRGEPEEAIGPPLALGEDRRAETAPVPGGSDHPEREDLDVRRAADEREPAADLPARRLDDRDVALAVDDRVAPVSQHLLGRPDRRAEMGDRLLVDELGRTLGVLVPGRTQAETLRKAHAIPSVTTVSFGSFSLATSPPASSERVRTTGVARRP